MALEFTVHLAGTVNESRYLRSGRLVLAAGGSNTDRLFLIFGVVIPSCLALVYVMYVCLRSCSTPKEKGIPAKGPVDNSKQFAPGPFFKHPDKIVSETGSEEDSNEVLA